MSLCMVSPTLAMTGKRQKRRNERRANKMRRNNKKIRKVLQSLFGKPANECRAEHENGFKMNRKWRQKRAWRCRNIRERRAAMKNCIFNVLAKKWLGFSKVTCQTLLYNMCMCVRVISVTRQVNDVSVSLSVEFGQKESNDKRCTARVESNFGTLSWRGL